MGASVPMQKNLFDYRVRFHADDLVLYSFSDNQLRARKYRLDSVHLMCNSETYGSLDFRLVVNQCIMWVKVYQELRHEIFL